MRSYLPTTIKIGAIAGVVLLLWVLVVEGNSVGSTFALGNDGDGLELTIDSHATYNGEFQPQLSWDLKDLVPGVDHFFDFENVLPGDTGTTTISIHVDKDDAYVCLDFENLIDKENATGDDDTVNEPESHEDFEAGGELADGMEFFAWFDDGDNVFEVGEKPLFGTSTQSGVFVLGSTTYALADSVVGLWERRTTHYVGITWCAGDLHVDLATAAISCDGSALGNIAQTDAFSVDVSLNAVQSKNFDDFVCGVTPGLDLQMEKKFSGPSEGFTPEQFSFHIFGEDIDGEAIDEVVPHGGSIYLPLGAYSIEEVVPEGFNIPDWRIQWSGDTCEGENVAGGLGYIEIETKDLKKKWSNCRADNQYRPENNPDNNGNNGHGNDDDHNDDSNPGNSNDPDDDTDDDGVPPGQLGSDQDVWHKVERQSRPLRDTLERLLGRLRRS